MENLDLQEKIERGIALYEDLLNKVHKGNIEEMYQHFLRSNPHVQLYGDTVEKRLINYCTYKRESVLALYK